MTLRVCVAGTFDPGFHRNQILLGLLREAGFDVDVCRVRLWGRRDDAVPGVRRAALGARALLAYPSLVARFLSRRRPDVVLVPYPGHFDVPLLAPLARRRGAPLVFDSFISLFDTITADRKLAAADSFLGRVAAWADRASCRAADQVLVDTPQHGDYFAAATGVPRHRFATLWLGSRDTVFRPHPEVVPHPRRVLFFGSFVPVHGTETIVRAAALLDRDGVEVRMIGRGQDRPAAERLIAALGSAHVALLDPLSDHALVDEIAGAALCLGVFGTSDKARRVVPSKVYDCLAVGRPVLTSATPAIATAFAPDEIATCPAADPEALAAAIRALLADPERRERLARAGHLRYRRDYATAPLARLLTHRFEEAVSAYRDPV
jgi:glycosyltransferase involved in cell wall biosynthesis